MYHKESISLKVLNLSQLPDFPVCEVSIQNKREFLAALYHLPSKRQDCFKMFLNEFEKLSVSITKKRSGFTVIVGDFNVRSTTFGLVI